MARDELDKLTCARSGSINSITTVSSTTSSINCNNNNNGSTINSSSNNGCTTLINNNNNNNLLLQQLQMQQNGRLSRASSSSSSGCLSDDNNGFDCEFTTGTIKRKPSMKPNLPLTTMTRQLKEVGEITMGSSVGTGVSGSTDGCSNPTTPERGGTLTRRHSRRRSEESNNSSGGGGGTLKRTSTLTRPIQQQQHHRGSIESMNSSTSQLTPTPSTPGTPSGTLHRPSLFINNNNTTTTASPIQTPNTPTLQQKTIYLSPMELMPSCMTDSVFSLPPPPDDIDINLSGSMMSLDSLPPPPLPSELNDFTEMNQASVPLALVVEEQSQQMIIVPPPPSQQQQIYTPKTSSLKSPPYKNPPQYNGSSGCNTLPTPSSSSSTPTPSIMKQVSFADSPVLLRRKVCFDDQVQIAPISRNSSRESIAPVPPPRAEATRLSTILTSPKRLIESQSNPPRDFLKDLQRVMRKKWQVSQKCKLEPTTTPHEVLGFRDFNELQQTLQTNYYSESANVSNWVQEHYGTNCLYENLGGINNVSGGSVIAASPQLTQPNSMIKKRPPPPPPKRSETTQLTTSRN